MRAPGWLRINRWWLPAVPLALMLAVGANSYEVRDGWWERDYREQIARAKPGQSVRVVAPYDDAHGETTRTFRVRVLGVESSDRYDARYGDTDKPVPEGMVLKRIKLEFEAEPDQDLNYCQFVVLDDQGNQYDAGPIDQALNACVPDDAPGPPAVISKDQKRGELPEGAQPRPRRWTVEPMVLAKAGARITEFRFGWFNNDYIALKLKG